MGGISCDPYHSTIGYVIVPPPLPLLEEYDEDDDKDGPVMITGEANPFAIIITGVGASAANIPGTIMLHNSQCPPRGDLFQFDTRILLKSQGKIDAFTYCYSLRRHAGLFM